MAKTGDSPVAAVNPIVCEANIPVLPVATAAAAELADLTHYINQRGTSGKKLGAVVLTAKLTSGKIAAATDLRLAFAQGADRTSGWTTYKAIAGVTPA